MFLKVLFVCIAFQLTVILCNTVNGNVVWNRHVHTGRHFNALITSGSSPDLVRIPAFLLLYEYSCVEEIHRPELRPENLPPAKYVMFGLYNQRIPEDYIWFDFDQEDDLEDRYTAHDCPEILFLANNSHITHQVPWISAEPLGEFIWRMFSVQLTIVNQMQEDVKVTVHGQRTVVAPFVVPPGNSTTVKAHVSNFVIVERAQDGKMLLGQIIDRKNPNGKFIIGINVYSVEPFVNVNSMTWLKETTAQEKEENERVLQWRSDVSTMFVTAIKQPIFVPKLTADGYKLIKLSEEVSNVLNTLYKEYKKHLTSDKYRVNLEPQVSSNDVGTFMIDLSVESSALRILKQHLQPVVEEWAGHRVELLGMSMLTYQNGTTIRPHVNKVDKQTITVLVDLAPVKASNRKWPIRLIDFVGSREEVILKPAEALMLECTMINYREPPFKGDLAVTVEVYLTVKESWSWKYTERYLTDGFTHEYLWALPSANITKDKNVNIRNIWDGKSSESGHDHDEL